MKAAAPKHSSAEQKHLICLGAIFGSAGIKGAVRVKVFAQDIKSITNYGPVIIVGPEFPDGKRFDVEVLHNVKGGVAAKLKGVNDRNMADALKGSELYIERSELPEIEEEGGFYFEDLIGLEARDREGNFFGTVDGVFNFGAGDIIEVMLEFEKGKRMYPFSNKVVPEVNLEAGYLVINRDAFEETEQDFQKDKKDKKG
jgi:16S rRNA processing protein RimM